MNLYRMNHYLAHLLKNLRFCLLSEAFPLSTRARVSLQLLKRVAVKDKLRL
jgi:hypothetical protein